MKCQHPARNIGRNTEKLPGMECDPTRPYHVFLGRRGNVAPEKPQKTAILSSRPDGPDCSDRFCRGWSAEAW